MMLHIEFCLDEIVCELDSLNGAVCETRLAQVKAKIDEIRALVAALPIVPGDAVSITEAVEIGDDLTLVRGIDAAVAALLAAKGVTRFSTIADWTAADIAGVAGDVIRAERIATEVWIEQAAVLATGKLTHYAARAQRGELACLVALPEPVIVPVAIEEIEEAAPVAEATATDDAGETPTLIVSSTYLPPVFEAAAEKISKLEPAAVETKAEIVEPAPAAQAVAIAAVAATNNVVPLPAKKAEGKWLRRASIAASLLMLLSVGLIGAQQKTPAGTPTQHVVSAD